MSSAKFASMTASLLARKGHAAPSLATLPTRPSVFGDQDPPFPPPPPRDFPAEIAPAPMPRVAPDEAPFFRPRPPRDFSGAIEPAPHSAPKRDPLPAQTQAELDPGEKPRRIVVTLSHEEFERLCIAAIKKDISRHDIVHTALEHYFQQLAAELPRRCACMAEGGCCG